MNNNQFVFGHLGNPLLKPALAFSMYEPTVGGEQIVSIPLSLRIVGFSRQLVVWSSQDVFYLHYRLIILTSNEFLCNILQQEVVLAKRLLKIPATSRDNRRSLLFTKKSNPWIYRPTNQTAVVISYVLPRCPEFPRQLLVPTLMLVKHLWLLVIRIQNIQWPIIM